MSDNQLEIFDPFGSTQIQCFSCTTPLPQNTEKVAEKHHCEGCLNTYIKNLEISHTVILPELST